MQLVEIPLSTPEETMALDEILLMKSEAGDMGETLRFWESEDYFVVLGRSGKTEEECFIDRCSTDGIKIIRRISGGGTVLQGKGCLNYSAVLSYENGKNYRHIRHCFLEILNKVTETINRKGVSLEVLPISDIAIDKKKVSGNAQARKRKYFLHHGSFLYDFDISKISKYLKHPPTEPGYRQSRNHCDFLANIPLSASEIRQALSEVFLPLNSSYLELSSMMAQNIKDLAESKYSSQKWNLSF